MAEIMAAKDALCASSGECYVTIDGERYNFMHAINVEITLEKTKTKVPILGKLNKGNKSVGFEITGKATFHYNSSIFRKLLYRYKNELIDTYFDMQITNEDKTSAAGRQTIVLKDCNLDGGILAKFDADSDDALDEEYEFTVEDWEMPEEFQMLVGIKQ